MPTMWIDWIAGIAQVLCSWMKTLGGVVASHSGEVPHDARRLEGRAAAQRVTLDRIAMLPGAGSLGLLVAESIGHLAMRADRDPKFEPSRSGFSLTLKTVPAANVVAGDALLRDRGGAGHLDAPFDVLAVRVLGQHLRSGAIRTKCSSAWLACATNCLTTPVTSTVLVWSYIANE